MLPASNMESVSLIYVDHHRMPSIGKHSGYRAGTLAQSPYTKWSSDRDEVDVEYEGRSRGAAGCFSGRKGRALRVLVALVAVTIVFLSGCLLSRHARYFLRDLCPAGSSLRQRSSYSVALSRRALGMTDRRRMRDGLRVFSRYVSLSGTKNAMLLRDELAAQLRASGLNVSTETYRVLLSYPDMQEASSVSTVRDNGSVEFLAGYTVPHERYHPELRAFAAYSPAGDVRGDLVYVNYARRDDLETLFGRRRDGAADASGCNRCIMIARYGGGSPARDKTRLAGEYNASALLVYPDPEQFCSPAPASASGLTWPRGPWLPSWAIRRESVLLETRGDPLTPGWPATVDADRLAEPMFVPELPVLPISYAIAATLLAQLNGSTGSDEFQGALRNVSYRTGPGFTQASLSLRVRVRNDLETRQIYDVVARIDGSEESDRYVLLGAAYDSWVFGASARASSCSVLQHVARTLGQLYAEGWRPRRSILFVHWDGSSHGLIGSHEWVEQFGHVLRGKVVAYVNLDRAVTGSSRLSVQASPLLYSSIRSVITDLPNPKLPFISVDDSLPDWSSDHVAFVSMLGAPVIWPRFVGGPADGGDGGDAAVSHHTSIDTDEYVERFVDPQMEAHGMLGQLVAEIVLRMSDDASDLLNVNGLTEKLEEAYDQLQVDMLDGQLPALVQAADHLRWAIGNFSNVTDTIADLQPLRYLDECALQLEAIFVVTETKKNGATLYNNLLLGPCLDQSDKTCLVPFVRRSLRDWATRKDVKRLGVAEHRVKQLTNAVRSCALVLDQCLMRILHLQ